jgi:acetyl esterase/lipase
MRIQQSLGVLVIFIAAAQSAAGAGPEPVKLWPDGAPGAVGNEPADIPELRIYLPEAEISTGAGIVVCPGGGYGALAMDHEGHQVAKWLNSIGVAGFVLKYRLGQRYKHPTPLQDAQRAMRYVRAHAEEWKVDPDRVGIMGFSAGGHLASTVATHFDAGDANSEDPIERQSCRPNFAVLCYPVISFTEAFGHTGSKRNLLGPNPDSQLVENLSNEKQVTGETPPTFLFHTGEDTGVPVENSLAFYQALRKAKVPAELHVYQDGPHGVGLAPGRPGLSTWKDRLADWLKNSGFLSGPMKRAAVNGTVEVNATATVDGGKPVSFGCITFVSETAANAPAVSARISRGRYSLPKDQGPVVGPNLVLVYNLGAVEPRPTLEEVGVHKLKCEILEGQNALDFLIPGE